MSKKKIILFSILGSILIITTIVSIYFIIAANKPKAKIKESEEKYETALNENALEGDPKNHAATDVISYLLWKVENTSSFKVITTGNAKASIANQTIYNERIVINKQAMVSTTSSGLISVAKQKFYSDNKVLIRDASKVDGVNTAWKEDEPECVSYDEMINRYGWLPWKANGYVICDETYLNKESIKVEDYEGGLYKVAFDLNPDDDKAPFWYRREILTTSNSTMAPIFKTIHIDLIFNKDYQIIYQDFQEAYEVERFFKVLTTTTVRDEFSYDNISFNQSYLSFFDKYKNLTPTT